MDRRLEGHEGSSNRPPETSTRWLYSSDASSSAQPGRAEIRDDMTDYYHRQIATLQRNRPRGYQAEIRDIQTNLRDYTGRLRQEGEAWIPPASDTHNYTTRRDYENATARGVSEYTQYTYLDRVNADILQMLESGHHLNNNDARSRLNTYYDRQAHISSVLQNARRQEDYALPLVSAPSYANHERDSDLYTLGEAPQYNGGSEQYDHEQYDHEQYGR